METFTHVLKLPFELMRSADNLDTLVGWFLMTAYVMIAGVALAVIAGSSYRLFDRMALEVRTEDGIVTRKKHRPGYTGTSFQYNAVLRVMLPVQHYVPPRWKVRATLRNGDEGWMAVSQAQYERIAELQKLRATYRVGRLSGRVLIDRLEFLPA